MQEAMALAAAETPATNGTKKKKKKRKSEGVAGELNGTNGHDETADTTLGLNETIGDENGEPKKKKKKKKNKDE